MKIKTEFDEFGWQLVVSKSKDGIIKIAQRSKDSSIHMMHKPMELRLRPEEYKKLKKILKQIK